MKTPERRHWCRSGVFIDNFEHVFTGWVIPFFFSKNFEITQNAAFFASKKNTQSFSLVIIKSSIHQKKLSQNWGKKRRKCSKIEVKVLMKWS